MSVYEHISIKKNAKNNPIHFLGIAKFNKLCQ
jgi:hypothetical protein